MGSINDALRATLAFECPDTICQFEPSLGHDVPPEVSHADFCYYLMRLQELYAKYGR